MYDIFFLRCTAFTQTKTLSVCQKYLGALCTHTHSDILRKTEVVAKKNKNSLQKLLENLLVRKTKMENCSHSWHLHETQLTLYTLLHTDCC